MQQIGQDGGRIRVRWENSRNGAGSLDEIRPPLVTSLYHEYVGGQWENLGSFKHLRSLG